MLQPSSLQPLPLPYTTAAQTPRSPLNELFDPEVDMIDSIRPTYTFVLRLWHEPDAPQGDAGWRGQVRLLQAKDVPTNPVSFSDLVNLVPTIRTLIDHTDEEA